MYPVASYCNQLQKLIFSGKLLQPLTNPYVQCLVLATSCKSMYPWQVIATSCKSSHSSKIHLIGQTLESKHLFVGGFYSEFQAKIMGGSNMYLIGQTLESKYLFIGGLHLFVGGFYSEFLSF